jgi:predicted  nucleic acid-binding Zn-ribbon protein
MDPFITQIIAWAGALGVSIYAGFKFNGAIQEQRRLPEATKWKNLKELIDQRQTQLNDKQAELAELKDRLEAAQKLIAEATVADEKIKDAKERYEALQAELLKLEADRKEQEAVRALVVLAKQELEALQEAKKALDVQIVELNKEIGNLIGQKAALESELSEKRKELEALKADYAAKSSEYKGALEELARQKGDEEQKLREAKSATDRANKEKTDAEKALADVLAKLDAANKANEAAKEELTKLRHLQKAAEDEVKRLEEKKADLERVISELKGEVSTVRGSGVGQALASEARYEDLWGKVRFQEITLSGGKISETEALKKAKKYIADCGLTFPNRVINAFHASLKTADMSPLVVLAGISGTGKSELPMRYAEGMGIHLVSLAVQPRWDSPNDLFGFYNHLEQRYKATDLARAMVRFERHNRKDWVLPAGWEADNVKSDGMLLVLLDEMNLARVEYYFSEFLSKLETRRGVNIESEADRAKAEIALDMGSMSLKEKAIKLYPDRNVLFAGTMNEDESTQSLSDKVLDRACVMRFGRPRQLALRPKSQRIMAKPTETGLTFAQWQQWLKPELNAEDMDTVQEWIDRLNVTMEKLNRPFGHRVAQAIARYIGNYPDDGSMDAEERLKCAMADQIEQRILPKLRGIDLEEQGGHLMEIRKLINDLGDDALLKAFDDSSNRDANTFIWRGVDRAES